MVSTLPAEEREEESIRKLESQALYICVLMCVTYWTAVRSRAERKVLRSAEHTLGLFVMSGVRKNSYSAGFVNSVSVT